MKLSEWAEREYTEKSRPSSSALRDMAKRGDIPGACQTTTGRWYVIDNMPAASIQDQLEALAGDDPIIRKAMGLAS